MRFVIASLVALGLFIGSTAAPVVAADSAYTLEADQQPPTGRLEVDIDTGGDGVWYADPMWIAIGAVVLIALIALVVAASRGKTTVVK